MYDMSEFIYKITLTGYGDDSVFSQVEKSKVEVIKYPIKNVTESNFILKDYTHRVKKDTLGQVVSGNINNTVGCIRFQMFVDNEDVIFDSVQELQNFAIGWLEKKLKQGQKTLESVKNLSTYKIIDITDMN
jgi:hypothetical protein